ncbi:MAG TPA: hypothetical protein VH277_20005, partial [Gemmatimonadaceae bacterium]|nr:hypothetical protein [Gemmatimonadaceae bacterium]
MDAKELLRRYLEQRREMGESELVLDRMSVDEAMGLMTGASDARTTGTRGSGLGPRELREPGRRTEDSVTGQEVREVTLPTREVA